MKLDSRVIFPDDSRNSVHVGMAPAELSCRRCRLKALSTGQPSRQPTGALVTSRGDSADGTLGEIPGSLRNEDVGSGLSDWVRG